MAVRHIHEKNIPELRQCFERKDQFNSNLAPILHTQHPEFGTFKVAHITFPGMFLLEMDWAIPQELVVHESHPSQTVDMNFVLDGCLQGAFEGLKTSFGMKKGTNNLKYTPEEFSKHHAGKQDARMFVVSMDKEYFLNLVGHNHTWGEMVHEKMHRNESFVASENFLETTPRMQALINTIRTMQATPMSRIQTQSLAFELMALQVDQLARQHNLRIPDTDVDTDDAQKLFYLKEYIEKNFLEDLHLSGLCKQVGLNEFKLKKGFKSLFGSSVIQYVRQLRMEYGQTLLRDNRLSIEEVASRLGYHYPQHFTVAYKKHFGRLPSIR